MAYIDYIHCKRCDIKVIYDGDWNGRERLEDMWGEGTLTVLCPDCIDKYEKTVAKTIECMRKGKWKLKQV